MLPPLPLADDEPLEAVTDSQESIKQAAAQHVRDRFRSIVSCDEAQGRSRLAVYLATSTDLTPEAAKSILAVADRETAADAPKNSGKPTAKELNASQCANFFEQHRAENPELWNPQQPLSVAETISRITHNYAAVAGLDVTPK